jgi:hypothetical protein
MSGVALRVESDCTCFTTVERPDLAPFVERRRPYFATRPDAHLSYVLNFSVVTLQNRRLPHYCVPEGPVRPS